MTEKRRSYFDELGFERGVQEAVDEIAETYLADELPWVVGYSGGKDSTAVLQLVWLALEKIGPAKARKPVHVISTDTLVENPVVAAWVGDSLKKMRQKAEEKGLPISAHRLTPQVTDSYWVNLIGKGYPAPRQKFRWCTERMKIKPANKFISSMVHQHGETMLVLGIRKAESKARARVMERHEKGRARDKISPNGSLPNSFIFSPIEAWSDDDVWMLLLETENPWGHDNNDLFAMYKGATADGECPMVVSSGTPSCGDSRFGCWVCTLVEKDKSMQAMIRNDEEKQWMAPLMNIRSKIDFRAMGEQDDDDEFRGDRHLRDFRRMSGRLHLFNGRLVHGPYTQGFREELLREVLMAQRKVRDEGPEYVRDLELITLPELEEVRRIWVVDKHEIEDRLPLIYGESMGEDYPGSRINDGLSFGAGEMMLLEEACGGDRMQYETAREVLATEESNRSALRRGKIFKQLHRAVERGSYKDEADALARAKERDVVWMARE